jgi:hypothetical protein
VPPKSQKNFLVVEYWNKTYHTKNWHSSWKRTVKKRKKAIYTKKKKWHPNVRVLQKSQKNVSVYESFKFVVSTISRCSSWHRFFIASHESPGSNIQLKSPPSMMCCVFKRGAVLLTKNSRLYLPHCAPEIGYTLKKILFPIARETTGPHWDWLPVSSSCVANYPTISGFVSWSKSRPAKAPKTQLFHIAIRFAENIWIQRLGQHPATNMRKKKQTFQSTD